MPRFVLTKLARADLKSIARYTADTWGRDQRNRYLALLDGCFHELANNPCKGKDCGYIRPGYRKQTVGRHVVFYRELDADYVEIVRILHERMDVESHLSESG